MPPTEKHDRGEPDPPPTQRSIRPKLGSETQQSEARRAVAAAYAAEPDALVDPAGDHAGPGRQAAGAERTYGESATAGDVLTWTPQACGIICRWSTAAELSAETAAALRAILRRNMQPLYGAAEWPAEWRRKNRNVLHRDSRHAPLWRLPRPCTA